MAETLGEFRYSKTKSPNGLPLNEGVLSPTDSSRSATINGAME
jgi:hypothetical protein